jgi:NADH-quinone oxidoreductase subunit M
MNFLSLFVLIPTLMMIGLFVSKTRNQILFVMTFGATLQLIFSSVVTYMYLSERAAGNMAEMLFTADTVWYAPFNIHYSVGIDGVSVVMLLLSAIIIFAGIFASWKINLLTKEFFIWYNLLSLGVFGFFICLDLFTMFMYYEIALVPMYLLIGVWGSGKKEFVAMKLILMLMGCSALLLMCILGIYYQSGASSMNILEIAKHGIPLQAQYYLFPLTFLAFAIKGAMFPFHTWLPDGHAAAPTAVSMFQAGVLMKLGGYGCFRIALYLMPEAAHEFAWIFIILSVISVIYGAFAAVAQKDLKYINAYSSVSHCGLVTFALLMFNQTAMTGAILQMLSHGLMAALIFALIGMIYGRTHTRMINEMSGLMKVLPFLGVSYVIGGLASLGLPGLSGFISEMTIFVGAFQEADTFNRVLTIIACNTIVITAVYILRMVGEILFGALQDEHHKHLEDATWYERISVVTLIAAIFAVGSAPFWISAMIGESVMPVITQLAK